MKREELRCQYNDFLILRNYRPLTRKTYNKHIDLFFDYCKIHSRCDYNIFDYAKSYLVHLFKEGKAWSSVNISYSAIKILVSDVMNLEWSYAIITRPKGKPKKATILSGIQIETMINGIKNIKHRLIVLLLYTTGIRINELINLEISCVLFDRNQLKINQGKGGVDRVVDVPGITIELIRYYINEYHPKRYLIEGPLPNNKYSGSSIRKIITRASEKAGILICVYPHLLRHTYATHHIENGTDLVTLQMQLGHKDIKTTIKYINLCQLQKRNIKHPVKNLNISIPTKIILVKSSEHTENPIS